LFRNQKQEVVCEEEQKKLVQIHKKIPKIYTKNICIKLQLVIVQVSEHDALVLACQHLNCLDKVVPPELEFKHFTRITFPLTPYKMLYPFQNSLMIGDKGSFYICFAHSKSNGSPCRTNLKRCNNTLNPWTPAMKWCWGAKTHF
jgi:hypothetical protein